VTALRDTGVILLLGAAWCAWGWFWPWKQCRGCRGRKGRGIGSTQFGYSRCGRCAGSGEQVRLTARLISKATGTAVRGSKEK
jgi:hypothetical protein